MNRVKDPAILMMLIWGGGGLFELVLGNDFVQLKWPLKHDLFQITR